MHEFEEVDEEKVRTFAKVFKHFFLYRRLALYLNILVRKIHMVLM